MEPTRVFATCDIGREAFERLRDTGCRVEVYASEAAPSYDQLLAQVASGIGALITSVRDQIDAPLLAAGASTLKVIGQYAVGVDNIDLDSAGRLGIPVTHTPDVLTAATAEFALFLMGSAARKLYPSESLVRNGQWAWWHPQLPLLGSEIAGKIVAVIGVGRIGQAFAARCCGLQVDLLLVHPRPIPDVVERLQGVLDVYHSNAFGTVTRRCRQTTLKEALAEADFVSLHVPLTPSTRSMIDANALRQMKRSACLINTSRGPVVDEEALATALKEGWIGGAALDVFEQEPLPMSSPLLQPELAERVRLTHHFGSGTRETRLSADPDRGMAGRCVQGVLDVLMGNYSGDPQRMPFVVNKRALLQG